MMKGASLVCVGLLLLGGALGNSWGWNTFGWGRPGGAIGFNPYLGNPYLSHGYGAKFGMYGGQQGYSPYQALEHLFNDIFKQIDDMLSNIEEVKYFDLLTLARNNGLTEFLDLIDLVGLTGTLQGPGPFTLWAPTNEALLAAIPLADRAGLLQSGQLLTIMKGLISPVELLSSGVTNDLLIPTLNGAGQDIRLNIFPNGAVTANCLLASSIDNQASNGILNIGRDGDPIFQPNSGNLVDTVAALDAETNGGYGIVSQALTTTGLDAVLAALPIGTLLLPNDAAFLSLPNCIVAQLNDVAFLTKLLSYHVIPSTQCALGFDTGPYTTVGGQDIGVSVGANDITINGNSVFQFETMASNGNVIEVSNVLIPPDEVC